MTNEEKAILRRMVKQYIEFLPNGKIFNLFELWVYIKNNTNISFKDCSLRNYLKAFGGVHLGSGQWTIQGLA